MTRPIGSRLLVALDESGASLSNIKYICRLISARSTSLTLLNIITGIDESFWDLDKNPQFHQAIHKANAWNRIREEKIQGLMDRSKQQLMGSGFHEKTIFVKINPMEKGVARDIAHEAKQHYDAVMIGRKGLSKIRGIVLGGTSNKLVQNMTNITVGIISGKSWHKNTLIAVDGSEGSSRAVDFAAKVLTPEDHSINIVHVLRYAGTLQDSEFESREYLNEEVGWVNRHLMDIKQFMENAVSLLVDFGFDRNRIQTKIVKNARSRAESIVKEANIAGCGTIVTGRRGLSNVQDFSMGKVCKKIIDISKSRTIWVVT